MKNQKRGRRFHNLPPSPLPFWRWLPEREQPKTGWRVSVCAAACEKAPHRSPGLVWEEEVVWVSVWLFVR